MKYYRDLLAQCRKTKHLILGFQFSIDDVLRSVQGNLESLDSIEISENPFKKYSLAEYKKYLSSEFESCVRELRIIIQTDGTRNNQDAIETLTKYCEPLEKSCSFRIIPV